MKTWEGYSYKFQEKKQLKEQSRAEKLLFGVLAKYQDGWASPGQFIDKVQEILYQYRNQISIEKQLQQVFQRYATGDPGFTHAYEMAEELEGLISEMMI